MACGTGNRCIGMIINLPFSRFWSSLAPTTRAALWMLVGGFCAVMMNVLIRLAAERHRRDNAAERVSPGRPNLASRASRCAT